MVEDSLARGFGCPGDDRPVADALIAAGEGLVPVPGRVEEVDRRIPGDAVPGGSDVHGAIVHGEDVAGVQDVGPPAHLEREVVQLARGPFQDRDVVVAVADGQPAGDDEPLWRGISAVPTVSCVWMFGDGSTRVVRRWAVPAPELPLDEGARNLREALIAAVGTRTSLNRELSADLSGGLDSTTICWLTHRSGRRFTTFTTDTGDPRDDDPRWASLAADQLNPARRIVAGVADLPMHYADVLDELPALDEPFPGIGDRSEYRAVTARLLAAGAELHLTGDGGDEVVTGTEAYLPEVLRQRPIRALAHLRAYRAHQRWSVRTTLRAIRAPDARALLLRNADSLAARLPATASLPRDEAPVIRAYLPPWASADAVAAVQAALRDAAQRVGAHPGGVAQHEAMRGIAYSGHVTRSVGQFTASLGLPIASPFLDDHVIEACLAVRPDERADPWRYKPLLTTAMRGVVPDSSLERTSKADGASLAVRSIRAHRDKLLALCESSALAELGLVDVEPLRRACSTSLWPSDLTPIAFSSTFSCERWLRDLLRQPIDLPEFTFEPEGTAR